MTSVWMSYFPAHFDITAKIYIKLFFFVNDRLLQSVFNLECRMNVIYPTVFAYIFTVNISLSIFKMIWTYYETNDL